MSTIQISRSVADVAPGNEPIALSEAKIILDIAQSVDTYDAEVLRSIVSAREQFEKDTQRLTVSRTIVEKLDTFPDVDWRFYFRPVVSLTSITYFDTANASQTLSASIYSLDAPNRKILLAVDQVYPSQESRWDAVTVTYVAGQTLVSELAKRAMLCLVKIAFSDMDDGAVMKHERAYHDLMQRFMRASYP